MHWRNSNFQTTYFIAAKCHTADEAYRVLKAQKEERDMAIAKAKGGAHKIKARMLKALSQLDSDKEWEREEATGEILEIKAQEQQDKDCLEEAERESEFLQSLIDKVQPHRKFAHLPDHEAFQEAQYEEWRQELIFRAQNFIAAQGHIPPDHLATMRLHPAFEQSIQPVIEHAVSRVQQGKTPLLTKPTMAALLLENKE